MNANFMHSELDTTGILTDAVQRDYSDQELASYSRLTPELASVIDAMICNHDEPPALEDAIFQTKMAR